MGTAQLQGDLWGARAHEWTNLQEGAFQPLYEAAFDAAKVSKGTALLDVGCGAGLALTVAHKRGAKVSGLDAAALLVAIAKSRLPDAEIRIGEIEELPFADRTFDVVSGFNSFQYAADRVHALEEAKRVTKASGFVVTAIWGEADKCEMGGCLAALGKLMPPPPPGAPGPWALSPPGALESLVEQAGLKPDRAGSVTVVFPFADEETALCGLLAAGPAIRAIRNSSETEARKGVSEAIRPYRKSDGSYALKNEFRFLVSRV
jgi:SAM-dependent methyltransferase